MAKINNKVKWGLIVAGIISVIAILAIGKKIVDFEAESRAKRKPTEPEFTEKLVYVLDKDRYFTMFAYQGICEQGGPFWYHDNTRNIHTKVGRGILARNYFFTDGEQYLGFPTGAIDLNPNMSFYFSNDFGQTWINTVDAENGHVTVYTDSTEYTLYGGIDNEGRIKPRSPNFGVNYTKMNGFSDNPSAEKAKTSQESLEVERGTASFNAAKQTSESYSGSGNGVVDININLARIPGVLTPSGWNKMQCLNTSVLVTNDKGEREYNDNKIEKLFYAVDKQRYFSYLSAGETCDMAGEVFYNDLKRNIRQRLGYTKALPRGFESMPIRLSGTAFLALPLPEIDDKSRDNVLYVSYDYGHHWQRKTTQVHEDTESFVITDKIFFKLFGDVQKYTSFDINEFDKLNTENINKNNIKLLGRFAMVKNPLFQSNTDIFMDMSTKKAYQFNGKYDENKRVIPFNDINLETELTRKTPSGWTQTQCKPLSELQGVAINEPL